MIMPSDDKQFEQQRNMRYRIKRPLDIKFANNQARKEYVSLQTLIFQISYSHNINCPHFQCAVNLAVPVVYSLDDINSTAQFKVVAIFTRDLRFQPLLTSNGPGTLPRFLPEACIKVLPKALLWIFSEALTWAILEKPLRTKLVNHQQMLLVHRFSLLQWEEDDYRLARFIDRPKQINTQFAIDLIAAVPPTPSKERVICCDGGGGPTGHPKVFINLVSSSPNTTTSTTQRSRSPTTTTKSS
uniref:Zinc finger CHCC-type domain-containing protein n=1 Tax=Timema douglasi TaxID=61478 RepID=A0A7R8VCA5_TIMDO|nr:unnamed protein product [Timema douglasi]